MSSVITELPFVTGDDIARYFRPGQDIATKSALDTLKRQDLLTEGLRRTVRGERGRTRGSLHLYSYIMRDAAAAAGAGEIVEARALVKKAANAERRVGAKSLADILARAAAEIIAPTAPLDLGLLMKGVSSQPDVADLISKYMEAVAGLRPVRAKRVVMTCPGRVKSISDLTASVLLDNGVEMMLAIDVIPASGRDVGDPLLVQWTKLQRGMWTTAEPALELAGSESEALYPFTWSPGAASAEVPAAMLSRPATVRRSGRTSVVA